MFLLHLYSNSADSYVVQSLWWGVSCNFIPRAKVYSTILTWLISMIVQMLLSRVILFYDTARGFYLLPAITLLTFYIFYTVCLLCYIYTQETNSMWLQVDSVTVVFCWKFSFTLQHCYKKVALSSCWLWLSSYCYEHWWGPGVFNLFLFYMVRIHRIAVFRLSNASERLVWRPCSVGLFGSIRECPSVLLMRCCHWLQVASVWQWLIVIMPQ